MKRMIRFTSIIFLLCFCLSCYESSDDENGSNSAEIIVDMEIEILNYTNQYRAQQQLSALTMDEHVRDVARQHSLDMVERDFFDHANPDGENPGARLDKAGVTYTLWAENIARNQGYSDPAEKAMEQWIESPGHRANLINSSLTRLGVGVVAAGEEYYYTQLFIRP